MKKIFYLASIAALAFSSCAKDETAEVTLGVAGSGKIMATAGEADDTRAYLDSNQKFRWQANDGLGVYNDATYPMNNAEYVLTEGAESATGIFVGQKKFSADNNHLAVYPRLEQSLIPSVKWEWDYVPGAAKGTKGYVLTSDVTVKIPAEQTYQPGSFYSKTVPAVSTTFNVDANGDAAIKMQPVADYLFVNIKSTEPIETVSLQLFAGSTPIKLAGQGKVEAYHINGKMRYYLPSSEMTENIITLKTNDYADEVTCHQPNTFVFVIPGGILGTNRNIEAYIWVNKKASAGSSTGADFRAVAESTQALKDNPAVSDNTQLNKYVDNNGTPYDSQDDKTYLRTDETLNAKKDPNLSNLQTKTMQMENLVFWMNDKDSKGNRTSFTYNPDGAVIIENEGDLLRYLTEYDNSNAFGYYEKDAYICDNHTFDFSIANITALSDQLKKAGEYEQYEPYFAAYLAGKFPCITGGYINEFNGNGAVISDIVMPLDNKDGIFGNIVAAKNKNGIIKDVTFSGIVANNWAYVPYKVNLPGLILGNIGNGGKISNVTVEAAEGMAILDKANVDTYNALTIKDASKLNYIIADMDLNKDLKFKNWDVVSGVKTAVFGALDAVEHNVVTLPAGAEYSDLAKYIGADVDFTMNQTTLLPNGFPETEQLITDLVYAEALYPYYVQPADQTDNNVVSVLIGDVSYWTGDYTKATEDTGMPKKVGGNGTDKDYYKIEYAEQLAAGGAADSDIRIMRDMNLSEAINGWTMTTVRKIDGNGKTVSGIVMDTHIGHSQTNDATFYADGIAPVNADEIHNLTVDGVYIGITTYGTNNVVPPVIGGLALEARVVKGVTVKNLVIEGAGEGNNNEQYNSQDPVFIGWLVGFANNITVENSNVVGVNNSIKGVAGLVGGINVTTGAAIRNSAASNVTKVQSDLTDLVQINTYTWASQNVAAAQVGFVQNTSPAEKSITLSGAGAPAFIYDASNALNVIYGTAAYETVKNR